MKYIILALALVLTACGSGTSSPNTEDGAIKGYFEAEAAGRYSDASSMLSSQFIAAYSQEMLTKQFSFDHDLFQAGNGIKSISLTLLDQGTTKSYHAVIALNNGNSINKNVGTVLENGVWKVRIGG